jgi:hypothetical protein
MDMLRDYKGPTFGEDSEYMQSGTQRHRVG